ncbi:DUF1353 domain-containing protein [Dyadobacter sp. CY323]|uniref:DUF1353 domain-containing protein n=1 Tax=Dyadobacter sp. CY323 TaxID=2907302 RepID=UPI001F34408F|nr:DUF1353 domain-containing protein [Dyadobacter sp. CY323]MCE6993072.1 DUF1353 domain-containing protein [Dyadobacter sp. CY323]
MKKPILFIFIIFLAAFKQDKSPRFVGTVVAEFLNNGRQMKLIKEFAFVDAKKKKWHVPAGHIVDGASIPKPFWSIIGGPFEGKYRRASVVHDYYCDIKIIPWGEVHRMFYEACITEGADEILAKTMYAAVYAAGPRWATSVKTIIASSGNGIGKPKTLRVETFTILDGTGNSEVAERTVEWINSNNPTLNEIEKKLAPQLKYTITSKREIIKK